MKPVTVSIEVPQAREDVYDFLDVLANHESFTDHMLRDWRCAGPARGVGAPQPPAGDPQHQRPVRSAASVSA
jgi:hypothetical protein